MTSPHPQREEAARLWPEQSPESQPLVSAKPRSLEHCWWLAIGLAGKDIEIYYGWTAAHDAGSAIFGCCFALAIVYILRWALT